MLTSNQLLLRRLSRTTAFSPDERQTILELPMTTREVALGEDVICQGDNPSTCTLVLQGFLCRYKLTPDGRRQILSFHVPGDVPDFQSLHVGAMDHSLAAVSDAEVALVGHAPLRDAMVNHAAIADAVWREMLLEAAIYREWILGLGRRFALARVAHLLCELIYRLKAEGHDGAQFDLPLSQAQIADAMGLSIVHVNRVLQELRARRLFTLKGASLRLLDGEALKAVAEFDPDYLEPRTPLTRAEREAGRTTSAKRA
jgi:CRP-like cAMP-binding protein